MHLTLFLRQPARVPIGLAGKQTGIYKVAHGKLIRPAGLTKDIVTMDLVQQLAKPCEAVLDRLRVDTSYVSAVAPDSFKGGIIKSQRDGRVWQYLTDESGVDVLSPVHTSADGRSPTNLKSRFGEKICFRGGGIDIRHTLPKGTIEQVRQEVMRICMDLHAGRRLRVQHPS